ncbi:MAG: dihydropteroate synthase [Chloroflexi bacterium]|nr:dihydropteroate synthase [Chloroflexota bacterium]
MAVNKETSALGVTRCGPTVFRWGERTYIMGIINVTPDSFSGDGLGLNVQAAIAQGERFVEEGADILDVGGESTRPGHTPLTAEVEIRRVAPVIEALAKRVKVPISIDTSKGEVARRAVEAGATMLNDVWGLQRDPSLAALAAQRGLPVVVMHNQQGTQYRDLLRDVIDSLRCSIETAVEAGVPREQVIIDPGFGFGKTPEQNLELLRRLAELRVLGRPLLVGTSRKSMIGRVLGLPPEQRLEGTAATVALAIAGGADIVRVHDVQAMARVARMADAVVRAQRPT